MGCKTDKTRKCKSKQNEKKIKNNQNFSYLVFFSRIAEI